MELRQGVTAGQPVQWLPPGPSPVEWLSVTAEVAELAPGTYGTPRGTLIISAPGAARLRPW